MNSILSVQDLCLWYGSHQALKDINIEIPEKSITALIGPSGCGKSTFLKTLDRMNDLIPDVKITGSIKYKGEDIFEPSVDVSELRRQVGMVFQKPNPFPMSIYDNIAYGPRTHGVKSRAKLDEIVEQCAGRPSGTRSKTALKRMRWVFPAASSRDCASPARLRSSRRCC